MVDHLLKQITSPNTELKTEANIFRSSHYFEFTKTPMYLYTAASRLYLSTNTSPGRSRKRGIYATGRGERGSGKGVNFNGRGNNI